MNFISENFPVLELRVEDFLTPFQSCQALTINFIQPINIEPADLEFLKLPAALDLNREVILFGSGPVWLYSYLVEQCATAPWVGVSNIPLKAAVVVASRGEWPQVGDLIPLTGNQPAAGQAILIAGPPNSGKSVFSNALRRCLQGFQPQLRAFLHRANWDGEGNWVHETSDSEEVAQLRQQNQHKIHLLPNAKELIAQYFKYHGNAVKNIRALMDITLVDVGGMPQTEKMPVIEQCTHLIVISRDLEKVKDWLNLCENLQPVMVIESVKESRFEVVSEEPFLQVIAGPWETRETMKVPGMVLERVLELLPAFCEN